MITKRGSFDALHLGVSVVLLVCVYAGSVRADSSCLAMAKTGLERLYCEIEAKGGKLRISFKEFRGNPEKTQRLLLARPAKRLSLALPEQAKTRVEQAKATNAELPEFNAAVGKGLEGCRLATEYTKVICEHGNYQLLLNKPNEHLPQAVFGAENQLNIEPFTDATQDPEALKNYLGPAYAQYLTAMERLGLSATTMSYTRFYVTFMEARKLGLDFSERMFNMYELLKKEKAAMNVNSRLPSKLPNALDQCYALGHDRFICDNKHINWVFLLENS